VPSTRRGLEAVAAVRGVSVGKKECNLYIYVMFKRDFVRSEARSAGAAGAHEKTSTGRGRSGAGAGARRVGRRSLRLARMSDERGTPFGAPGAAAEPALVEGSGAVITGEAVGTGGAPAETARSPAWGLLRAARPKQWFKNVLVLAAPGAAGVLFEAPRLTGITLTFVALCLVASGTYLLNDVSDVEADRLHPRKRRRPVAAGVVSVPMAVAAGTVLLLCGLGLAFAVGWLVLAAVALYVVLSSVYTAWLKHVAVVDIVTIASLFVVRAVAGGLAASVPISRWFLIVASFGSLFVVAGKRYSESYDLGDGRGAVRATLDAYSPDFLRHVWTAASGVTLMAYCLWAFEQAGREAFPFFELSIVPFVLFVLRYALIVDAGRAGAPEDVVLGDRALQLIGAVWVVVFGLGVYLSA
jgi:decaprenyl-phosphate phosphoribosyltransferase